MKQRLCRGSLKDLTVGLAGFEEREYQNDSRGRWMFMARTNHEGTAGKTADCLRSELSQTSQIAWAPEPIAGVRAAKLLK